MQLMKKFKPTLPSGLRDLHELVLFEQIRPQEHRLALHAV